MIYDCMTAEELELWKRHSRYNRATSPCVDCPASFQAAEMAAGRCNRESPSQRGIRHVDLAVARLAQQSAARAYARRVRSAQ